MSNATETEPTLYTANGVYTTRRYTAQHWGRYKWMTDLNTNSVNEACDCADRIYDRLGYKRVRVVDNERGCVVAGYGVKRTCKES